MPKDCPKPPLITERARPTVHFYKMPYPRRPREQKRTIPSTPRGELPRPDQSLGRRIHIFLRILAAHSSFSISCAWPRMNCTGVSWLALGDGDATMHICSARHLCKALGLSRMRLCVFGAGLWSSRAYICMCVCVYSSSWLGWVPVVGTAGVFMHVQCTTRRLGLVGLYSGCCLTRTIACDCCVGTSEEASAARIDASNPSAMRCTLSHPDFARARTSKSLENHAVLG
jgi:hypothetical protein